MGEHLQSANIDPASYSHVLKWTIMKPEDGGAGMTGTEALIYADIVSYSRGGESNGFYGTVKYLALTTGSSTRQVQRALRRLEDDGFIIAVGTKPNTMAPPSTVWQWVPEKYYECASNFERFWSGEIKDAIRSGQTVVDGYGRKLDLKTALMNIGEDVTDVVDEVDAAFEELWAQTVNKNSKAACGMQYRTLIREGYSPKEISGAWLALQSRLSKTRPSDKMPNFARWVTGQAGGVKDARSAINARRAYAARKSKSGARPWKRTVEGTSFDGEPGSLLKTGPVEWGRLAPEGAEGLYQTVLRE